MAALFPSLWLPAAGIFPERDPGLGRHSEGMPRWYWLLWWSLVTQRLRELHLSRSRARDKSGPVADPDGFPVMVATHVGLFLLPPLEARMTHPHGGRRFGWALLLLAAGALRLWSINSLGDQWNVRGLVPDDLRPITIGPYRWIRHPNYLAVALEFAALPMATGAWRSALGLSVLNGSVLWRRIRAEEKLLGERPGYSEAFAKKARFIPHIL